jgi:hypothetical protein
VYVSLNKATTVAVGECFKVMAKLQCCITSSVAQPISVDKNVLQVFSLQRAVTLSFVTGSL